VLSQIGISTEERYGFQLVEPLKTLFKGQVRKVARYLGLPKEIAERQPFPGPGLSVRIVGEIRKDKLESLKKATAIAEEKLAKHEPSQYFAVILDNVEKPHGAQALQIELQTADFLKISPNQVSATIFEDKATGIREDKRIYGEISALKILTNKGDIHQPDIQSLIDLQSKIVAENPLMTRVFYAIREKSSKQPYVVAIRAVKTEDFLTAKVADIPWTTLDEIAEEVLNACGNVSTIYYDVTPKPTATIEME
jgi:GMP synthase (glutamine-hydrolysing)